MAAWTEAEIVDLLRKHRVALDSGVKVTRIVLPSDRSIPIRDLNAVTISFEKAETRRGVEYAVTEKMYFPEIGYGHFLGTVELYTIQTSTTVSLDTGIEEV